MSEPAESRNNLRSRLKALMVEALMLQLSAAEIGDEQPLFGPGGIGLDSVDALQLVVLLDKNFQLKVSDAEAAKVVLVSVESIARAIEQQIQGLGG